MAFSCIVGLTHHFLVRPVDQYYLTRNLVGRKRTTSRKLPVSVGNRLLSEHQLSLVTDSHQNGDRPPVGNLGWNNYDGALLFVFTENPVCSD